MLLNEAPFEQKLPLISISFSDISGNIITRRSFHPEEYLHGELAGLSAFPPNQPVRVAIEIMDPGSQAVNYDIKVL